MITHPYLKVRIIVTKAATPHCWIYVARFLSDRLWIKLKILIPILCGTMLREAIEMLAFLANEMIQLQTYLCGEKSHENVPHLDPKPKIFLYMKFPVKYGL